MINLDDEDTISVLGDLIGKNARNCFRRLVKNETKPEKFETRILCLCEFRTYIILIKNNKPSKIELQFHFFDIKRLESLSKTQLFILTNDNRELKIAPYDAPCSELIDYIYTEIDEISDLSVIDEIISFYCSNFLNIFPSVTIKDLIDTVNIQPEKRLQFIYNEICEMKQLKKKLQICGCFSKSYSVHCSYIGMTCFQEVIWDVNLIYGQNGLTEFSLNDFDYVNPKDSMPLISALKFNPWFDGFYSDGIKLTHEMQDEFAKMLAQPLCNIQNITLIHINLKPDFLQRILSAFQASKSFKQYSLISSTNGKVTNSFTSFKSINLSRNSVEDKGLNSLSNLFKEFPILCNLDTLILSKCSLTTKSLNGLFSSISDNIANKLKYLDLSFNNLKEEPIEIYKYLCEPNELIELNLSHTELDVDKLFNSLSRGGCRQNLKKIILTGIHTFHKITNTEYLATFIRTTKALTHFDLSSCKLPGTILQIILANLKLNTHMIDGIYFNLAMNDLGSSIKSFMHEFNNVNSLTALDLSENNLDSDSDILLSHLQHTQIKSLSLSKNFLNTKSKIVNRIILALTTWAVSKHTTLRKLWLSDCKLRSHLNDFINELGSFSYLRLLDISGNDIGDIGINYLSKSLQVNRSLHYLMFDRSNVSVVSYTSIMKAIERNFTLKSIQIPINDICNLYQKSPDKVNDIAKQMTELFSHRKLLLNAQNKCDLDSLFKTKMKLINEPFAATTSLNSHSIPRSPSHSMNNNNQKSTDAEIFYSNDLHVASKINTPQYIKEILQNLNESASTYLNQNPIEKQFSKFSSQILEKIDDVTVDLEEELNSTLKKKYPNYISNQNLLNEKDKTGVVELTSLKNNISDYMNSMLVQIHNDICEMTYKMSATMAEKLINESHKNPGLLSSANKETAPILPQSILSPSSSITSTASKNTISELESLLSSRQNNPESIDTETIAGSTTPSSKKPPNGGVKCLPFLPSSKILENSKNRNGENNNISVQQRFELTNNSKSKRPISSQLQETENFNNIDDNLNGFQYNHVNSPRHNGHIGFMPLKTTSSTNKNFDTKNTIILDSSNENLCMSEDELENKKFSNPSSREKTPDSFHNELENVFSKNHNKALPPLPSSSQTSHLDALPKSPENITEQVTFRNTKSVTDNSESNVQNNILNNSTTTTPIPAPRRVNKSSVIKNFLGLGTNSPSTPKDSPSTQMSSSRIHGSSPSLGRKIAPLAAEKMAPETPNLKIESIEETSEPKRLNHLNKSRPKRANVRRPTKNPQININVELTAEDLDVPTSSTIKESIKEAVEDISEHVQNASEKQEQNDSNKKISPVNPASHHPKPTNTVEQPKISLNLLEGVKLRNTSKLKQMTDNNNVENDTQNSQTGTSTNPVTTNPTTLASANNKLGNRFSMFEQQQTGNFSAHKIPNFPRNKIELTSNSESSKLNEIADEGTGGINLEEKVSLSKINKPLPPVPVLPPKPPRPVLPKGLSNKPNCSEQPSILVKLRPVQNGNKNNSGNMNTNNNNNKLNNELNTNIIFNTNNHNLSNNSVNKTNKLISNENNYPNKVSSSVNGEKNDNMNENGSSKNNIQRLVHDSDKRASVRELAQMMFEESKA